MVADTAAPHGPIERLIRYCAQNPLITLLLIAASGFWGYRALMDTPLDAVPDLSDVQVILYTEWPGRSPDLVEDQITYPLTAALLAAPGVQSVRGQSYMGLSFVYVIFEDGTDIYWARSRVLEYLNSARARLPDGVQLHSGPTRPPSAGSSSMLSSISPETIVSRISGVSKILPCAIG